MGWVLRHQLLLHKPFFDGHKFSPVGFLDRPSGKNAVGARVRGLFGCGVVLRPIGGVADGTTAQSGGFLAAGGMGCGHFGVVDHGVRAEARIGRC